MAARLPPEELLQQEVRELTDLLRHADSFADLRDALAVRGVPASETILAGLYESEDYSRTGVILTASQECIRFDTAPDGSFTRWDIVDEPDNLTYDFQAVSVGISMISHGVGKLVLCGLVSQRTHECPIWLRGEGRLVP